MLKTRNGFTLTEILIAVVLLGVVASFGMPSYNKAREKADEKEAVHNVRMMGEAVKNFMIRNNGNFPPDAAQYSDINTILNLGVIENAVDYNCEDSLDPDPGPGYICLGVSRPDLWEVHWESTLDRVVCKLANCPSEDVDDVYPEVF